MEPSGATTGSSSRVRPAGCPSTTDTRYSPARQVEDAPLQRELVVAHVGRRPLGPLGGDGGGELVTARAHDAQVASNHRHRHRPPQVLDVGRTGRHRVGDELERHLLRGPLRMNTGQRSPAQSTSGSSSSTTTRAEPSIVSPSARSTNSHDASSPAQVATTVASTRASPLAGGVVCGAVSVVASVDGGRRRHISVGRRRHRAVPTRIGRRQRRRFRAASGFGVVARRVPTTATAPATAGQPPTAPPHPSSPRALPPLLDAHAHVPIMTDHDDDVVGRDPMRQIPGAHQCPDRNLHRRPLTAARRTRIRRCWCAGPGPAPAGPDNADGVLPDHPAGSATHLVVAVSVADVHEILDALQAVGADPRVVGGWVSTLLSGSTHESTQISTLRSAPRRWSRRSLPLNSGGSR